MLPGLLLAGLLALPEAADAYEVGDARITTPKV
jgi:hypothetical protein